MKPWSLLAVALLLSSVPTAEAQVPQAMFAAATVGWADAQASGGFVALQSRVAGELNLLDAPRSLPVTDHGFEIQADSATVRVVSADVYYDAEVAVGTVPPPVGPIPSQSIHSAEA